MSKRLAGLALLALLPALLTGCAATGPGSDSEDRALSGDGQASDSLGTGSPSPRATVGCEDLPHLWSGAHDIAYDPQSGIVRFGWPDGTAADVLDSEAGCTEQPGLEGQLADYRDGAEASERASCQELQHLVDAVRAERRGRGQSTSGSVPVSEAAQAAAAAKAGVPADAVPKPGSGGRLIDLDEADKVLEQCPR